ncbi:flavin-containing monooxygenase [Mycolicibacterium thermoresistibile]
MEHDVVIVGAGASGLAAAIALKQAGRSDFVILERAETLGGTWFHNTYPGAACDVPSALYSFSSLPNPDWPQIFAPQEAILQYLNAVADQFELRPHLRFDTTLTDARWDEASSRWTVATTSGVYVARVLVVAIGSLHTPMKPDIPGLDSFAGKIIHTAEWPDGYLGAGERVAVVGTGASSIQVVPQLQRNAMSVSVFQRTPSWILPKPDAHIPGPVRTLFRRVPISLRAFRALQYGIVELQLKGLTNPTITKALTALARWHINRSIPDPALRDAVTPDYQLGCKRTLVSNDFYPAIQQDNVTLVTSAVRSVDGDSVVAEDGSRHPVDTIVLATGFQFGLGPTANLISGNNNETLAEFWQGSPRAYKATTVPGFPNLALMWGPNLGTGSQFHAAESQAAYIADMVRRTAESESIVEVRPAALGEFVQRCDEHTSKSVQNSGCVSFYLDENGRNHTLWPGSMSAMKRELCTFDAAAYVQTPVGGPRVSVFHSTPGDQAAPTPAAEPH